MHQALSLTNVENLPPYLRTAAKSAANGSSRALLTLFLSFPNMPREHMALTLPVLFLYLDPAGVPTSQELDAILCAPDPERLHELHTLRDATLALKGVAALAYKSLVPPDAFPEMWPRLYLWITFLHTYWDVIPIRMAFNETEAYSVYSCIILAVAHRPRTSVLIQGVPGLRTIITHWWATLLHNDGVIPDEAHMPQPDGWLEICSILAVLSTDLMETGNLEEILDEVGGKQALVFLLHKHIDLALARLPSRAPGRTETIARGIQFIYSMVDREGLLDTMLLSRGFVGTLVKAIPVLRAGEIGHRLSEMGLVGVYKCFQHPKSDPWIIQALQAGLLGVMISLGTSAKERLLGAGNCYNILEDLLQHILPGSLIYYRVSCQMKISFPAALDLASAPAFRESAIYDLWKSFEIFVERRLAGLDYFESGGWISSKACENMQCLKMAAKSQFRKCGGCGVPCYCSRECQKADWSNGHRDVCQELQTRKPLGNLSPRERSFIRAFMEHDFRSAGLAAEVMIFQLQFIYQNPGVEFFTVFDYSRLAARDWISVLPFLVYDMVPNAPVRVSRGPTKRDCLQEHMVRGEGGRTPWSMLFQRWTSSSKLADGLALIAGTIPPGCDFQEVYKLVAPKVRELLVQLNGNVGWREVF
ncbi:hypothetical protein B0H11DRAFT_19545 [Mycena galericulata]|nr:hypothetical protein B0H11DRAFT_19545 [Mycena galericulata]